MLNTSGQKFHAYGFRNVHLWSHGMISITINNYLFRNV